MTTITENGEDRLSAMPEEILHHILSYLYMTEVIKTSLISTRWRNLWKSHPFFKLHPTRSSKFINGVMDFIEHVLLLRDHHSSKLVRFRLRSRLNSQVERFLGSIVTAVNQGVQVIDTKQSHLSYDDDEYDYEGEGISITTLNPCIFNSGVVSVFKFAVTDSRFRVEIPLSICSSIHLKIVDLHGIVLPKGDSKKKELHLICPCLQELTIRNCSHKHLNVLSISTPNLETLCIYNNCESPYRKILGQCILEIGTPKLKSFKYTGYSYVDYSFKDNLLYLTHATVALQQPVNKLDQDTIFLRSIKILKGIWNVKWLWIDRFENFSWPLLKNTLRMEEEVLMFNPFVGLKDLTLRSIPSLSSVHGMAYLLLHTSNVLETFVWEVRQGGSVEEENEGEEEHEDVMLLECSFSHLKLVKTMNLQGHKNEFIFLRFLMKSTIVLEEMVITTTNQENIEKDREYQKKRRMFMAELQALRHLSPSTKLSFKIDNVIVRKPSAIQKVGAYQPSATQKVGAYQVPAHPPHNSINPPVPVTDEVEVPPMQLLNEHRRAHIEQFLRGNSTNPLPAIPAGFNHHNMEVEASPEEDDVEEF